MSDDYKKQLDAFARRERWRQLPLILWALIPAFIGIYLLLVYYFTPPIGFKDSALLQENSKEEPLKSPSQPQQ